MKTEGNEVIDLVPVGAGLHPLGQVIVQQIPGNGDGQKGAYGGLHGPPDPMYRDTGVTFCQQALDVAEIPNYGVPERPDLLRVASCEGGLAVLEFLEGIFELDL